MSISIRGNCEQMCPSQEVQMRVKEHLLHFYELKSGGNNVPGILVKAFSRSAAGARAPRKQDLRTENALNRTVQYLLREILLDNRRSYCFAYDFIFDRMRAVRQEVVIQNFDARSTVRLLEPMIMFLAYSRYRLCEEPIDNFDPKICDQHLQECLKRVLCCYDDIPESSLWDNRCFIESLYQLFNLGSGEALGRIVTVPEDIKLNATFADVQLIALSHLQGNFYRVLCGISRLPHILAAIACIKLNAIRRNVLHIFSAAFSSKQLTVPAKWVQDVLLYSDDEIFCKDCKMLGIEYLTDQKSVRFSKAGFKLDCPIQKCQREEFVEKKLKMVNLSQVLLFVSLEM